MQHTNRISEFADLPPAPNDATTYIPAPVNDPAAYAARVAGDAMEPKYHEGDIVVFSPAAAVLDGDDCYVRLADGRATFRRVFHEKDASGKPVLRLQPRNSAMQDQHVRAADVTCHKAVLRYPYGK